MHLTQAQTGWHEALRIMDAMSYRAPRHVTKFRVYRNGDSYPICPRCGMCIDREYVNFCDCCGQRLDWRLFPG